jgi:dipeptidase E
MGPILLASGGLRTPERVAVWANEVRAVLGPIHRLLFIPYALADHDEYLRVLTERSIHAGYVLDGLHRHADPLAAVRDAEAILVGGGNTFRLLATLYCLNLLDAIRSRVAAGMPYLGISAGTNIACPTIRTTNDMPIVEPPSLAALGLVPFQVNPHYYTGSHYVRSGETFVEYFGVTRDDRLREFHEENDIPVVGLCEGGILRLIGGQVILVGANARVFRKGESPVDVEPQAELTSLVIS